MSKRLGLEDILDNKGGEEDITFTIPNIFVPPRWQHAHGNSLLLCIDVDLEVTLRWAGENTVPWIPLSPLAARKLLLEVRNKVLAYERDCETIAEFIQEFGSTEQTDPMSLNELWARPQPYIPIKIGSAEKRKPQTPAEKILASVGAKEE